MGRSVLTSPLALLSHFSKGKLGLILIYTEVVNAQLLTGQSSLETTFQALSGISSSSARTRLPPPKTHTHTSTHTNTLAGWRVFFPLCQGVNHRMRCKAELSLAFESRRSLGAEMTLLRITNYHLISTDAAFYCFLIFFLGCPWPFIISPALDHSFMACCSLSIFFPPCLTGLYFSLPNNGFLQPPHLV